MNIQKNYKKTIDWYNKNASEYAEKSKKFPKIDLEQLNEFTSLLSKKSFILDAGCGSGRDSHLFQEKGFRVIGIDLSEKLIDQAKVGYPNCNFEIGDILKLKFPKKYFDAVWAHASLVHFDNLDQFKISIEQLSKVLKDNGFIHILVRAVSENTKNDSVSNNKRNYLNLTTDELSTILKNEKLKILILKQYNENDLDPNKRPGEGVEWILAIAKKII